VREGHGESAGRLRSAPARSRSLLAHALSSFPFLPSSFESKGYTLRALKMLSVSKELAEEHYADLSSKPFFAGLVEYICR